MENETNNESNLVILTTKLIDLISREVNAVTHLGSDEFKWRQPSVWEKIIEGLRDILGYYRNSSDMVGLAEVLVGLGKQLDFYSKDWMPQGVLNDLNTQVEQIVIIAISTISTQGVRF